MSDWQAIETAPKDGTRVDLWAKCWRPFDDQFSTARFPACYWTKGDSMTNHNAHWMRLDSGWYPTHWMPEPAPPSAAREDPT